MKVYFAADHAGFTLKQELVNFVRGQLSCDVEDCGATTLDAADDYPEIVAHAAALLARDASQGIDARAIVIGASGQGEAMVANRFPEVRAAVFYGNSSTMQIDESGIHLDMIKSARMHNNANALAIGARFVSVDEAKEAVRSWLITPFSREERHHRRVKAIEQYPA